jgi:hypothetical protein
VTRDEIDGFVNQHPVLWNLMPAGSTRRVRQWNDPGSDVQLFLSPDDLIKFLLRVKEQGDR